MIVGYNDRGYSKLSFSTYIPDLNKTQKATYHIQWVLFYSLANVNLISKQSTEGPILEERKVYIEVMFL